jgi:hypothetical protein
MGRCGFYGQLSEEDELGPCESGANATWCPQLSSSLKVLLAMRLTLPISAPTGSFGRAATRIPTGRLRCSIAGRGEVPVNRGPTDPQSRGDGRHGVLPRVVHLLCDLHLMGGHDEGATAVAVGAESLPLIGASTWWLAHVFLRSGRIEEATGLLRTGIDALEPDLGHAGPAHLSVWGAMLLTSAITAAKRNDRTDAWAYVREARKAADRLGRDGNYLATAFGPTNVALRTVAIPVELGDAGEALQVARTIDPSPLAPNLLERRAMFHIDVARAYGQRRNDAAAVATLLEAERIAPEEIHYHVVVRELLRELLKRERRTATPGLRPLAQRVGVL